MEKQERADKLAGCFALQDVVWNARPYGSGHINETFVLEAKDCPERYILQWINGFVFKRPRDVMENIAGVTGWLQKCIRVEGGDPKRETLTIIPTKNGDLLYEDEEGGAWRVFRFIDGAFGRDLPENPGVFKETGRGFGRFQRRLSGYPAETLKEVIPGFHDTPGRYKQLITAIERDAVGRRSEVRAEIEFCHARKDEYGLLLTQLKEGKIPLRVTHNDTKVNNLLLDSDTGCALCVIDLDTVMPGLAAYDFGDAIRTGASTAAEDERDLNKVGVSLEMYRAFAQGFLSEAGSRMERDEICSLAVGAKLMTLENGLRFLTDYLNGDVYFKVHHPRQNLDRARAQFALAEDMDHKIKEMLDIVIDAAGRF